jgi:hypothetical protein
MNAVKREEDPNPLGFSHTRLGMERALEKQNTATISSNSAPYAAHLEEH